MWRCVSLAVAIWALGGSVRAEEPGTDIPKAGPRDVEVKLHDGSLVRGELQSIDTLTLKTAYGVLNFPITSLIKVTPAAKMPDQDAAAISSAIKGLDNDDFAKRNEAQKKLETFGASAVAAMQ